MKIKESLLELFESNKGIFLSGENIAKNLGCSRTAVWKAVKALQSDGYSIDAVPNKGYLLSAETDILSSQGIRKYLSPLCRSRLEITVLPSVNSTNAYLQENIGSGIKDGYTVLAHRQTNGKGRIGRSFFSPPDTGVYMSLLLRPENYSAEQAMQITTIASVAACEALETVSEHTASIKWVNDVYIGKKKSAVFSQKHPLRWKISFLTTQFWESVSTLILRKKDFHPSLTTLFVLSLKSESPMEKTG